MVAAAAAVVVADVVLAADVCIDIRLLLLVVVAVFSKPTVVVRVDISMLFCSQSSIADYGS